MSSLLDVAKAMNTEASGNSANLSLVDVAKAANGSTKPLTLMDVAKQKKQPSQAPKQTLQQLAQEIDEEDRSQIQAALESTAKEVKVERQELRSQILKQTAAEVRLEDQQAAQALSDQVASVTNSKQKVANSDSNKENDDDDDGYSSFEDDSDSDSTPKKDNKKQKEVVASEEDNPADDKESYDPPPRTTPSESKESKEFLRAVYRADKYQVRDMLDGEVVDANIADQVGCSIDPLDSSSLEHTNSFPVCFLSLAARLEWVALGCFSKPQRNLATSCPKRS